MNDITICTRAFSKIILHAAKYPHCTLNGILLIDKKKSEATNSLFFVDAVPLFHICPGLTPMLEVALAQIELSSKSTNLSIGGYYQANENMNDNLPDVFAQRIVEKIAENSSDVCLIMIDNQQLSKDLESSPLIVSHLNDGKFRTKEKSSIHLEHSETTLSTTSSLLHRQAYKELIDFDNHLDDITQDWWNPSLNKKINQLVAI